MNKVVAPRILGGHVPLLRAGLTAVLVLPCLVSVVNATGLQNPMNQASLYCFLSSILKAVVLILFPIIVLIAVYSGYLFVAAQGNPAKITEARRFALWVFVGALIVLGAQVLAFAVESTVENIYVQSGLGDSLTTGREACP